MQIHRNAGRHILILATGALLSGCMSLTPTTPSDTGTAASLTARPAILRSYTPIAVIKDSVSPENKRKADFFYVSAINGEKVEDSRLKTLAANRGHGFEMTPETIARSIPVQETTFTIVGRTEYAAPILTLTNTVYQVTGAITFTPEASHRYVVRGKLGEDYSAVWIEDEETGTLVSNKIETYGSSALGTLDK
ncbi:MAG: hypothetical protein LBE50_05845 [Gallionellaceae bacterium]|jgi:hypothetical protein|nr:hypothetical protein [Gallionellaceae bacterium]